MYVLHCSTVLRLLNCHFKVHLSLEKNEIKKEKKNNLRLRLKSGISIFVNAHDLKKERPKKNFSQKTYIIDFVTNDHLKKKRRKIKIEIS